jgi:hypothetical protein
MNASDAFVRAALLQSCEKSEILKHIDLNNTDNETLRLLINKYNRLSIRKIPIILTKYITKSGLEFLKRQFPRVGSYITPENISVDVADDELACLVETESDYKPSIYILVLKNISISVLGSTIETFKSSLLNSSNSSTLIDSRIADKSKQHDGNYKVKITVNKSDELENKITEDGKISVHEDTEPFKKVETPQHYTDIFSPKTVENNIDDYMSSTSSTSSILSSSSLSASSIPKYKQKTQQTTIETIRNNNHKLYNDNKTLAKQTIIDEKRLITFDENNNKIERSLSMSSTKSSSSNKSIQSLSFEVPSQQQQPTTVVAETAPAAVVVAKSLPELITNENLNNLNEKQENKSKIIILENRQIKSPIFNIPKPIIPSEVKSPPSCNNAIISNKLLNHQYKEQVLAKQQQQQKDMEIEDDDDDDDNNNVDEEDDDEEEDDEVVSLISSDDDDKLINEEEKKIDNLRSLKSGDFKLPKMKKVGNDDFINLITANGFSPTRQQQHHHQQQQSQKTKISIDDDF